MDVMTEEMASDGVTCFDKTAALRRTSPMGTEQFVIEGILTPIICVFGILGNILNIVVLTRKQLKGSMDHMEKSAHLGLVALALSDMVFCVVSFADGVVPEPPFVVLVDYVQDNLWYFFKKYEHHIVNMFILSSTWLTVIMALSRYIAICHPLHARSFINLRATRAAIVLIFILAIALFIPLFYTTPYLVTDMCNITNSNIRQQDCPCMVRMADSQGDKYISAHVQFVYQIIMSVIGLFLPVAVLIFCNICLIRALRRSQRLQRQYRANAPQDSGHRITPTLITIIILFIILVAPSEFVNFYINYGNSAIHTWEISRITNLMLTINFAINFVLYCILNVHFRRTFTRLVTCAWARKDTNGEYVRSNLVNTVTCNVSDLETEV